MSTATLEKPLTLPPGRTEAEALALAVEWRRTVWKQWARNEDHRLARLKAICTRICNGDQESGSRLATKALWS